MKPTRRDVLSAGAAVLTSATIGRFFPQKRTVTGQGDHVYEVHHDWLTPPSHISWGDTHGLTQDSQGHIYVAHTVNKNSLSPDGVVVFDSDGKFVTSWGAMFAGGAHGIDIRKEGGEELLYHCDIGRRLIVKTTLDGAVLWERGFPTEPEVYESKSRWRPTNVAFAPNGDFFVGDGYGSSYIHRYTKDGDYVSLFCGPGSEAGQVSCPHSVWVDERGDEPLLVVADRTNHRLQYFTLEGEHVKLVTDGMRRPCDIDFRGDETLVADLDSVVTILDKDDKVLVHLGDDHPTNLRGKPRSDFIPGKFIHPHDAIWINDGDVLVAEWVPIGRVTLLKKV